MCSAERQQLYVVQYYAEKCMLSVQSVCVLWNSSTVITLKIQQTSFEI